MTLKRELLKVPNYNVELNSDGTNNKDWFKYFADVGDGVKTLEDDLNNNVETLNTDIDTLETSVTNITNQLTTDIVPGIMTIGDFKLSFSPSDHESWLLLDGRTLSRTEYADLYNWVIANNLLRSGPGPMEFGTGDGSTSFTIPNPGGLAIVAAGAGAGLTPRTPGASGGEENHTMTTEELVAHTHQASNVLVSTAFTRADAGTGFNHSPVTITTTSTGSTTPFNIMQPWGAINAFVKYA